jgi:transaldolase/transaldolase/glucose-6-phosphate isomerase
VIRKLEQAGISMMAVTDQLVEDGVKSFSESFEQLISAVGTRVKSGGGRK